MERALVASKGGLRPAADSLLREAVEALRCNYAIFDAERRLVDYSASYAELHRTAFEAIPAGLRYDDLMREAIRQTLGDATPAIQAAELARRIAAHESDSPGDFDRLYPGGRWMRVAKHRLSGGHVAGLAIDITALKEREAAIAASEARYRALIDTAPVGIWHLDEGGRTLFANARLAALYGGTVPDSLAGAPLQRHDALASEGPFGFPCGREVEAVIPARSNRPKAHVLVCASDWLPAPDGDSDRSTILTLLDITPLKAAQAQAEHLAWHDALTGLGNRAQFQRALEEVADERQDAVLLMVDLDHFKEVNDRYGHAAGDAMLRAVAVHLRMAAHHDDLVCRLGGDEFAILLRGADAAQRAPALADGLASALQQAVPADGIQLAASASIGHATFPTDADDIEGWQRAADLALYAAKHAGRGQAVAFQPVLLDTVQQRRRFVAAFTEAIAVDALRLAWQPQVSVPGRALRGAEALVRWPAGPSGIGEALPGSFLPAIAEAGLLPALDIWVLDAALTQMSAWVGMPGAPGIAAINISAATLSDPAFPARVGTALLRHRVPAEMLEIEVPEDVATRDLDAIAPVLEDLRALGVRLALDDFGGGLSSISHLIRLPVGLVKLDRSIIAGLPGSSERAMLRAVVAMAGSLGLPVLAEGVETDAQLFSVRREGCTLVQGYLFGRPMAADVLVPQEAQCTGRVT
ncbi:MAG: putative bifunctional diguanylate cyclase/phosphodiesterase [Janthinobacterium lividum]